MTQINNDSCEARIKDYMNDREEYLKSIYEAIDNQTGVDGYDDPYDCLSEFPLEISKFETVKILLSTGGPGDWLEVKVDPSYGRVMSISYHFNDWFDHASRDVSKDSYLFQYASEIVENLYY